MGSKKRRQRKEGCSVQIGTLCIRKGNELTESLHEAALKLAKMKRTGSVVVIVVLVTAYVVEGSSPCINGSMGCNHGHLELPATSGAHSD